MILIEGLSGRECRHIIPRSSFMSEFPMSEFPDTTAKQPPPEGGKLRLLAQRCRVVRASLPMTLLRHVYYRVRGKNLLVSNRVKIRGLENLFPEAHLSVGMSDYGFMHNKDWTYLNAMGKVVFGGPFGIGKGSRLDVGPEAEVIFGSGYIGPNTDLIIGHGMTVGDDCAISWGCQFIDRDFHEIDYPGRVAVKDPRIVIGSHVWIGSRVTVLKGTRIPDGCIVAAGSVVGGVFTEENCLLAGSPAKVIRREVSWQ